MNRIALLTSNHQRHRWLAARLAEVAQLVCVVAEEKPAQNQGASSDDAVEISEYFQARDEREAYWFGGAPGRFEQVATQSRALAWQGANTPEVLQLLKECRVERVFLFGSSIIRDPLLAHFSGRIVNMHLGLSPYYRGSATNYWPMVDGLPECVGVTVHHATAIVDGGGILAQARPDVAAGDNIHDVGCKAIIAGGMLLRQFALWPGPLPAGASQSGHGKLCRRADFGIDSLRVLKSNMEGGILRDYLGEKAMRDARYPIVQIPSMNP